LLIFPHVKSSLKMKKRIYINPSIVHTVAMAFGIQNKSGEFLVVREMRQWLSFYRKNELPYLQ